MWCIIFVFFLVNGLYILWQCNLDTDFSRFISSAGLPVLLGNLLTTSVPKFDSLQTYTHRDGIVIHLNYRKTFCRCFTHSLCYVIYMSCNRFEYNAMDILGIFSTVWIWIFAVFVNNQFYFVCILFTSG